MYNIDIEIIAVIYIKSIIIYTSGFTDIYKY